jgi:DegV family protein with EDD domain
MKYKIVADSSSDRQKLEKAAFSAVPLHIIVGGESFTDDKDIDTDRMQEVLDQCKKPTTSSCPSPGDWVDAFEDADIVFCVAMTSALSGSYASACTAKHIYEEEHPDRKVFVFDSLTTGPEMALIIDRLEELVLEGKDADSIIRELEGYRKKTHLTFMMTSIKNMAKNGRVSSLLAKGISLASIRLACEASEEGKLSLRDKCRGQKKALEKMLNFMKEKGYNGGKVIISYHLNPEAAKEMKEKILGLFPAAKVEIHKAGALCSYYAEKGAILVGYETMM